MADRFVIVTSRIRSGRKRHLFMVDRRIQRESFWSDRLEDVMFWRSRSAADSRVRTMRHNDPRVIEFGEALALECENHQHARRPIR